MLLSGNTKIKLVGMESTTLSEIYKRMLGRLQPSLHAYGWDIYKGVGVIPMPMPALQVVNTDMYEVILSNGEVFTCRSTRLLFQDLGGVNFLRECPFLSGKDKLVVPYIPYTGIKNLLHSVGLGKANKKVFVSKVFRVAGKEPIFEVILPDHMSIVLGCGVVVCRQRQLYSKPYIRELS